MAAHSCQEKKEKLGVMKINIKVNNDKIEIRSGLYKSKYDIRSQSCDFRGQIHNWGTTAAMCCQESGQLDLLQLLCGPDFI